MVWFGEVCLYVDNEKENVFRRNKDSQGTQCFNKSRFIYAKRQTSLPPKIAPFFVIP